MFQLVYSNLGSIIGFWFNVHVIASLHDDCKFLWTDSPSSDSDFASLALSSLAVNVFSVFTLLFLINV